MPNITYLFLQYSLVVVEVRTCSGQSLWMDSTLVYFCVFFVCFHFWLVISYSTHCPSQQDNNSKPHWSVDQYLVNNVDIAAFSPVKPRGSGRDVHTEGFHW